MNAFRQIAGVAAALAAAALPAVARPNLDAPRPRGGFMVYADDQRPGLFYYGPGELGVAQAADGRPEFHFLQTRYTGTAVTADRGRLLQRGLITFTVVMPAPRPEELQAARRELVAGAGSVELRPLPIRRLDADLVYTPVGSVAEPATALPPGHFEEGESAAPAGVGAFWTTRSFSLGLDPASSELFWGALNKDQVVLSLSYSFYAAAGPEPAAKARVVRAGAVSISVDATRWPGLFRRQDINERVPPGYPLLDVYCYDFRDALHPSLYEKQVEVEAEGVGGRPVGARARFGRDQSDLYARGVRFGVAVQLDRPYHYRVTEVADDGRSTVGPWVVRKSWNELLDVTTPREPEPAAEARTGGER